MIRRRGRRSGRSPPGLSWLRGADRLLLWTKRDPSPLRRAGARRLRRVPAGNAAVAADVRGDADPGDRRPDAWDERPNYLGHPSPFYWYETLFSTARCRWSGLMRLRLGSAALAAGGIGLALWAGWRHVRGVAGGAAVFCVAGGAVPEAAGDDGAGDQRRAGDPVPAGWPIGAPAPRPGGGAGIAACGLGLMLAMWAKPNAALAIGVALGVLSLLRRGRGRALILAMAAGWAGSVRTGHPGQVRCAGADHGRAVRPRTSVPGPPMFRRSCSRSHIRSAWTRPGPGRSGMGAGVAAAVVGRCSRRRSLED